MFAWFVEQMVCLAHMFSFTMNKLAIRGETFLQCTTWVCSSNIKEWLEIRFLGFAREREKKLLWQNAVCLAGKE